MLELERAAAVHIHLYMMPFRGYILARCGIRPLAPVKRVIDGEVAAPNSWPWQAEILTRTPKGDYRHKCGGSLIKPQWIVTAAHCLFSEPDPREYLVVLG